MTWPQSPQQPDPSQPTGGFPVPAPGQLGGAPPSGYPGGPGQPASGGTVSLPVGALITGVAGILTLLFSFVRIFKVEAGSFDSGWSVWTTDFAPGLFGVGTWIPVLALAAGVLALVRGFVKGFDDKSIGGFTPLQLQLVAAVVPVLIWGGYLISILFSNSGSIAGGSPDFEFGLGMLLLFIGLAGVLAGTVFDVVQTGLPKPTAGVPGAPGPGTWPGGGDPAGGTPAPTPGTWTSAPAQGTPAPPPAAGEWAPQPQAPSAPAPGEWSQPPAAPAAPTPGDWTQQPGAAPAPPPPGDWTQQPQAAPAAPPQAAPPPAAPPAAAPEGGGALIDPGTQVIPGPPPAPPAPGSDDDAGHDDGTGGLPPLPPSNTP